MTHLTPYTDSEIAERAARTPVSRALGQTPASGSGQTPASAVHLIERAADACYAAADDTMARQLYSDAAYLYRSRGSLDDAARCAEMIRQIGRAA